jgi:hypothetical protein
MPTLTCSECGNDKFTNDYMLNRHMKARHTDHTAAVASEVEAAGPHEQVLKFNIPVEFQINGRKFEGTEISVPYDSVSAALDIVRTAYGAEAIAL